jgi:hypothetical protein
MTRSRWPVFFAALVLLWCAWWYCRGAGQGLLFAAAGVAAAAVARRRALPGTSRWVIWSGLLLTVVCLAANVERLVPPEDALEESRAVDRMITVAFAAGLTALFFRPTAHSVTLAALGGMPLTMATLARQEGEPGAAGRFALLIVWGLAALLMAADLAQRLSQARPGGGTAPGTREVVWRVAVLGAVAAAAFGLRVPVERAVKEAQRTLSGWMLYSERLPKRRIADLNLALPAPVDFGRRMRVVALIDSGALPGYLRENVFVRYRSGKWEALRPGAPLREAANGPSAAKQTLYALVPEEAAQGATALWRVEVLAPRLMSCFCLPGNAVALACAGPPPLAETNGTVAADGVLPDSYGVRVEPRRVTDTAWPRPDGAGDAAYLDVPGPLAGAVAEWAAGCAGLSDAASVPEAVRRVEEYFAAAFTYRLGVRLRSEPDPLVDFMERKEGACTLFASAAALMFRARGVPSRVVGGFVCSGWNPWLKRWTVRERDGHAWVEVWDAAAGRWLVADPTPPAGRPAALDKPGRFRLALDLWTAGWKRFLAYLRGAGFLEVLADAGATFFEFLWHVVWSVPGFVVMAGFGLVGWLRHRARRRRLTPEGRLRAELIRAMRGVERRAVPAHLRRRAFESWEAWLRRAGPALGPEHLAALRERVETYQALRYSVRLDEAAARAWLERGSSPFQRPRELS